MTALEYFKAQAAEITRQKQEAIRIGKNEITYTDHEGKTHTLYYTSHRWVDSMAMATIRRQFSGVTE